MKKTLLLIALVGFSLTLTGSAMGYYLVDTDANTTTGDPPVGLNGFYYAKALDYPPQFLYGQFTTTQAWTITEEKGYIWTYQGWGGVVNIGIYPDAAGMPDPAKPRWIDSFTPADRDSAGFQGLQALNHYLPAGTYWIGFTVPDDSAFAGGMGGTVPHPMQSEAYYLPLGYPIGEPAFMGNYTLNLGVRIEGVNPVPLPPSLLLLGGGLLGLGFLGRRRF